MKIKTSELEGAALDWAVAKSAGWAVSFRPVSEYANASTGHKMQATGHWLVMTDDEDEFCEPSTDWGQGGPLIERLCSALNWFEDGDWWSHSGNRLGVGSSPLVAAMRAIVAAELGDEIDVPDELAEAS